MGLFDKLFGKKNVSGQNAQEKPAPSPHPSSSASGGAAPSKGFAEAAADKERTSPVTDQELLTLFAEYFAPNKSFYSNPGSPEFQAYFGAIQKAQLEMLNNPALYQAATKRTRDELIAMINNPKPAITNMLICGLIYCMGNYAVVRSFVYCVDFSEKVPYCAALCLLLQAEKLPKDKRRQMIDAGDGVNKAPLQQALDSLKVLDPDWNPVIA